MKFCSKHDRTLVAQTAQKALTEAAIIYNTTADYQVIFLFRNKIKKGTRVGAFEGEGRQFF